MSNLLFLPRVIRVVDFEGTGQENPAEASIVEVGWCDLTEIQEGWEAAAWPLSELVRPTAPMLVEAMAIHHIHPSDVAKGAARDDILRDVADESGVVAFAAHGAKFEASMWPEQTLPWIDTYKLAMRAYPDAPRHSVQVLRYYLELDLGTRSMPPHRAGPDAYVTAHILSRILETMSIDEAIAISAKPGLLPRCPIGKDRGKRWSEVSIDHLYWIVARDFGEDVLFTARTEIDRREAAYEAEREEEGEDVRD